MSTVPVSVDAVEAITESTRPAMAVIFEGIELAHYEIDRLVAQNDSLTNLKQPASAHQYVSLARFLVREHIVAHESEMGEWCLNTSITMNGAILLHSGMQHVRLLHHRPQASVPHAGRNPSRVQWFTNEEPATDPALLMKPQTLLLLWQAWQPERARLVHTLTAGSYGRSPHVDMDVRVLREEEDFSSVSFQAELDQPLDDMHIDESEMTGTDDVFPGES